jgi:hypothetical protein
MRLLTTNAEHTMASIQDKITNDICNTFEKYGFDPVTVKSCSNVGYWSIQRPDSLDEYGRVNFDFQGSYNIFRITIGDRKIESQPGRADYFDFHIKTSENDRYQNFKKVLDAELFELNYELDGPSGSVYAGSYE